MSQKEAADVFGLSPNTLSSWNSGRRKASHEVIYEVAQFFELSVEQIAYGEAVEVVRAAAEPERFLSVETKLQRKRVPLKSV